MTVLCQWCGATNRDDREFCRRCNSKLLVVSGDAEELFADHVDDETEALDSERRAFDEHVLERLSASEETSKRLTTVVARLEQRVADLEHSAALLDAGVQALVDLLDRRKVVRESEVIAAWERAASTELAREELLDRLRQRRDVIVSRARTAGENAAAVCARALQSAELALVAGQPVRASELLTDALRRVPHNPELAGLLGELAFERSDLAAAEGFFRQVVRWEPGNVEGRIYLGTILSDRGRAEEAEKELEAAVHLAPDSFLPHFSLGALFAAAGQPERARGHLRAALERDTLPQGYFLLGLVELDCGHPQAAIDALQKALENEGDFEEAIYYLGLAYLERGWHRKALECFRRVLEIDPQRLQYQEAVRLIEGDGGAGPLPPETEALVRKASEAAESGNIPRALAQLERALRVADHPSLLAFYALLASGAGKHRKALAAVHRLLREPSGGAPVLAAWTALLETLRATRRFRAAARWGERLLAEGQGPIERAIAAYELALVELERGGELERALELAHSSLELIPRELRQYPLSALGRIHLEMKAYSDAVDYLEQAAGLSDSPAILTQLGLALIEAGDGGRAREVLQRARSGAARDLKTDVLTHLARVGWLAEHGRRRG